MAPIPAIHRLVAFYVYPGFDILDLGGAASVFAQAANHRPGAYVRHVVSTHGGAVVSSSGVAVETETAIRSPVHTLVVLGGAPDLVRRPPEEVLRPIVDMAAVSRRVVSTCTGAYLLANAGLLTGRACTTHWTFAADFQNRFPTIHLQTDRIFVKDGRVWTSAGGTAVIDLALALVEEDLGVELARLIARRLVVYHRRPGAQSQLSALLDLDPPSDRIARALSFARDHLHERLTVGRLAEAASLSERQFGRAFMAQTGMSPAKAIERLRVEAARPLVEEGRQTLEVIARASGFADAERMRQAFLRTVGEPPHVLRRSRRSSIGERPPRRRA